MKVYRIAVLFVALTAVCLAQVPAVNNSETLPPKLAALVPPGMKMLYQRITSGPTLAAAEFSVEKALPEGHTLSYTFALNAYDTNGPIWAMQGPIYKSDVDHKVAQEIRNEPNADLVKADSPTVTKYAWGSGVTRRLTHHPPESKEYVDYSCVYFGMVGGVTFDLHVSGMQGSCDAANQWAGNVAATAGKTSVSNITF